MATGICGDAELCKRVFFFSCGRSRNRNETCKTASSPKSHLSLYLRRVQNAVTSDRTTDGLSMSDWLDDNEAASGDFAAELIFYSQSARPPTPSNSLPPWMAFASPSVTDGRPIWGWEFALRLPRKTGAAARELGKFPRGSLAVELCFVRKWYLASCDRAVCLCAILPSGRYPSLSEPRKG